MNWQDIEFPWVKEEAWMVLEAHMRKLVHEGATADDGLPRVPEAELAAVLDTLVDNCRGAFDAIYPSRDKGLLTGALKAEIERTLREYSDSLAARRGD